MKAWWKIQSARIDALTLRERVFLFVSILAAFIALADVMWLSPAQAAHSQLKQRFAKQGIELQRLREETKAEALKPSPARLAREELARTRTETNNVNLQINQVSASTTQGTPLAQVLEQFLRRHGGLTLVSTTTLVPEAGAGKSPQSGSLPVGLSRTGLELTVSGSYPELVGYVQTLEKALPNLRWGKMKLASDTQPPQLSLQVYVVGVQP
jgi:MSHA biogenesis protein MshJ